MHRIARRGRQAGIETPHATRMERETSEGESSNPQTQANMEEQLFNRIAQRLVASIESTQGDPEKKYGIEKFKAFGAQVFEGTTDPAEAEVWLNQVEKCFRVIHCPEDRKLDLVVYMLQRGAEDWWRLIEQRSSNVSPLTWADFKKFFQEKYYPKSYCDEKRKEFFEFGSRAYVCS